MVRAHPWPTQTETTGDGSLVLTYERGHRCYLREVGPDGTVTGWLLKAHPTCPWVLRLNSGLLGSDFGDFIDSFDLSDPPREVPVARTRYGSLALVTPSSAPESQVGCCAACSARAAPRLLRRTARRLRLFSRDRTACTSLPSVVLAVDPRGRVWAAGAHKTVTVTDGSKHWASAPLPATPDELMVGGDSSAVLWTRNAAGDMYVSSDSGRSWTRVKTPPEDAQDPELARMLPDGRVLLGPYNGQLWRGTDARNTEFDALDAGPITTVLSAGTRLYGLADTAPERSLHHLVWMSTDDGSTWRQVIDSAGQPRTARAARAADLSLPAQQSAAARISRLAPHDVALGRHGLVLVTYGARPRSAWRLYDAKGRIVAESLTAAADVSPAGDGFVLSTDAGMQFVDAAGHSIPVNVHLSSRRAVAADDSPFPGGGVFRPSEVAIFTGTASPDGVVSTVDGHGRMWALGHGAAGRTVVRSAVAGGRWRSHDLGPAIGAQNVQGAGSTLLVPGRRTMYVSLDAGATWTLRPGPYPQGEGPGSFRVWPDGTIVTGDYRAQYRISHDGGKTFEDPSDGDDVTPRLLGDLFARGAPGATEVSQDRVHWRRFTPALVRRWLGHDEDRLGR